MSLDPSTGADWGKQCIHVHDGATNISYSDTQYTRQNGISNIEHLSLLSTAPWRLINIMAAYPAIILDVHGKPTGRTLRFNSVPVAAAFNVP
jgi:hypothetical protein